MKNKVIILWMRWDVIIIAIIIIIIIFFFFKDTSLYIKPKPFYFLIIIIYHVLEWTDQTLEPKQKTLVWAGVDKHFRLSERKHCASKIYDATVHLWVAVVSIV